MPSWVGQNPRKPEVEDTWASLVAQWQRICLECRRHRFEPCVGKVPWRRKWPPTRLLAWSIPQTEGPGGLLGSQSNMAERLNKVPSPVIFLKWGVERERTCPRAAGQAWGLSRGLGPPAQGLAVQRQRPSDQIGALTCDHSCLLSSLALC